MADWIPILKTVLPYLTSVMTAAVPAFQARKDEEKIAELQAAALQNAHSMKVLAEQFQRALEAIEAGARANERMIRQVRILSVIALAAAIASLIGLTAAIWWR
ncbi:MAG: hypothetical protein ACJ8KA_02235 [Sulfurifustis sp.]